MRGLTKKEFQNLPVSVPKDWVPWLEERADRLGTSRNSVFCRLVKIAAPILEAEMIRSERKIRALAVRIAGRKLPASKILGPAVKSPLRRRLPSA